MNRRIPLLIIFLLFFNMVTGIMIPHAGAAASSPLQSLGLSTGSLNESFDPNTKAYTATVPNNVSSITVTPTVSKRSTVFGYALFTGGASPSRLTISGNSNTIVGSVHVNGDLSLKGNSNGITQTAEVVGSVNNHKGVIGRLVQPSASIPFPQINLAEYKKNASKSYTTSLNLSDVNLDGNIFVDGDVNISGSKIQGKGTILATGSIHIAGSNLKYSSTNDSAIFYSMNGDIHIAGSGGEIDGGLFAPNGQVKLTGHDNKIYGSVIVKDIDIAGSINQIINDYQLGSAVVRINDKVVPSGMASPSIPLNVGPNTIKVDVTEFDGTLNSYTVTVTRTSNNADLSNLTVTTAGGTAIPLSPAFSKSTINYSSHVDYTVSTVAVQATLDDPTATVVYKIGDQVVNPAQVPLAVGSNWITVVVTAQDGTKKTYTITITRNPSSNNANLIQLTMTPGTLIPVFSSGTYNYVGEVLKGKQSVTVTAIAADPNATIQINGSPPQKGQATSQVNLQIGTNVIPVTVQAPDGTRTTYTITILIKSSDAGLSNLEVKSGASIIPLSPTFSKSATNYSASVDYEVSTVAVEATISNPQATKVYKLGNQVVDPDHVPLAIGANTITVEVTAEDGTQTTYMILITRAAASMEAGLSDLTMDPGNLSPSYAPDTFHYSGEVPSGTQLVTVTAKAAEPNATIQINNSQAHVAEASEPIILSVGTNRFDVAVTAQDGITVKDYSITIIVKSSDADLVGLTVTSGETNVPLSPLFEQETLEYSASVENEISTVSIQAAVEDPTATVTYRSPDGTELDPAHIQLAVGSNTIQVIVTAEDGTQKTYTITITITKSEVPPMFSLSQQMIIGDYVMVKITPDQSTIMDNTEWYKYDLKDGQRQWIKLATGHFPTSDGTAVTGITLSSTVDDNGAALFMHPQTVLIKAVTNGLSTEKPVAVDFSSTNGRIDGSGYKFKILASSNGGTQNMATSGNRAAKVSIVYNIAVSDGLTVNFVNGTPNYVMKDQAGNKVLEGELYKDGVNQDSTPTVKFIKSTNGYTEQYRIQATIDMILATSSGEKLPLTLYSDPLSVIVESRERLQ